MIAARNPGGGGRSTNEALPPPIAGRFQGNSGGSDPRPLEAGEKVLRGVASLKWLRPWLSPAASGHAPCQGAGRTVEDLARLERAKPLQEAGAMKAEALSIIYIHIIRSHN